MEYNISQGDALCKYASWPSPIVIVSDGPYGLGSFIGDPKNTNSLDKWYKPHIKAWSKYSSPLTTLWFWNSEIGWAKVHHVLEEQGWIYRACCIWDKGISHIAGNSNTKTLRKFPVVTEVCVHYIRSPEFTINKEKQKISAKMWLRNEWLRSGIPFNKANEACRVKNAATRKYLTKDHLWYFPPGKMFDRLSSYANLHGKEDEKPYFSIDGKNILTGSQWEKLRAKFNCEIGVTNVWREPPLRSKERIKIKNKSIHPNQKPLSLMKRIINCSSDVGDVVWEPFGGLFSASVAAVRSRRQAFTAEINQDVYEYGLERFLKDKNETIY